MGGPVHDTDPGRSPGRAGRGLRVNFERRGTGTPLVLIHGIGHHWRAWEPVLDGLAAAHDVIAIDLPGFGESAMPAAERPATMETIVAHLAEFFGEQEILRPHVAGNSLGGGIALELAAAGLVSSATALAPAGFFNDWELRWALAVLRLHRASAYLPEPLIRQAMAVPALRTLFFGTAVGRPSAITPERALADARAMRRATAFEPVARASRGYAFAGAPRVPVTVAWGTQDRILPPWQARRAEQRLPQARHVRLPGCGHVPMSDDPELIVSLILETTRQPVAGDPDLPSAPGRRVPAQRRSPETKRGAGLGPPVASRGRGTPQTM